MSAYIDIRFDYASFLDVGSQRKSVLVAAARQEVEVVRKQHEWLSSEVRQTEDETSQYEAYMNAKSHREQSRLQNMSEHNASELAAIAAESKAVEAKFNKQVQGMLAF